MMTEEEIIDCLKTTGLNEEFVVEFYEEMELFAKLVAKKEREACAVIAETPISGEQDDITMEAKDRVAKAIRARGQK